MGVLNTPSGTDEQWISGGNPKGPGGESYKKFFLKVMLPFR